MDECKALVGILAVHKIALSIIEVRLTELSSLPARCSDGELVNAFSLLLGKPSGVLLRSVLWEPLDRLLTARF